ncbi:hypothetical protein JR316_0006750 [Psilocybe cubensis]|nr:hypothetical protein JR316_0006750 [Psilocybe cubensis]KAH9480153.1 hypothetical protein JR316_0006750 [Psilocybe cubensis]
MKRQSKGTVFDISIHGDELENNRIQLEHNLQNTELSFRLSTTSDDEREYEHQRRQDGQHRTQRSSRQHQRKNHNNSSVEYPRHISEPSLADDYPPFWGNRSRGVDDENFNDEQQHMRGAWSYRSGDDEEGISPYGGNNTVSTAAHHASAITIHTGLGGGRAARRDREPSLSGAEYDPDRPLHAMIAGVNSKHSMFDMDPSKSKHNAAATMTYDPVVVDNTAELDRILASGHAPAAVPPTPSPPPVISRSFSFHPTPPTSSVSSDSENQAQHQQSSRLKLTDHLRHVSFSPKRPRSAQSPVLRSTRPLEETQPNTNNDNNNNASMNMPTPRPARRTASSNHAAARSPAQPEVRLQPATPSTGGSKFTRMARGINREIEETQAQEIDAARTAAAASRASYTANPRPASAPPERNPFYDIGVGSGGRTGATTRRTTARDAANLTANASGKVYLPDVTGLTSAVESPAKPGAQFMQYKAGERPRDSEARLLQTLSTVQTQLQNLEEENSISRRRVRELEMELEECKRHVARERTRLFEREETNTGSMYVRERAGGSGKVDKGKGKAVGNMEDIDEERLHARYKEAVDEKKALEALITSLRSHLTRLTSELASHQSLLNELRALRSSDSQAIREKGDEIVRLRDEVQRLAGEVEVLRGVVEEGLRERRASREEIAVQEVGVQSFVGDVGMSQDLEEQSEEEEEESHSEAEDEDDESRETEEDASDEDDDSNLEPFDPSSVRHSSPAQRAADRTMRTDHATLGSSMYTPNNQHRGNDNEEGSPRFVGEEELNVIAQEMEERRANRSGQQHSHQQSTMTRPAAPTPNHANQRYRTRQDSGERARISPEPYANHAVHADANVELDEALETPFPQIRGERLERLFFSAPEHNAKTCTVCYRRRNRERAGSFGSNETSPGHSSSHSWSRPAARRQDQGYEDEGYEGSEGAAPARDSGSGNNGKGKQREYVAFSEDIRHWQRVGQTYGVPPQTVVARVIRELEDDFTHYKSIYVELADQYKVMDAASDVKRRNLLAKHLREVVDVLEQKGDKIAALYDLLEFKDKPAKNAPLSSTSRGIPSKSATASAN